MSLLFIKSLLSIVMAILAVVAMFTMLEVIGRSERGRTHPKGHIPQHFCPYDNNPLGAEDILCRTLQTILQPGQDHRVPDGPADTWHGGNIRHLLPACHGIWRGSLKNLFLARLPTIFASLNHLVCKGGHVQVMRVKHLDQGPCLCQHGIRYDEPFKRNRWPLLDVMQGLERTKRDRSCLTPAIGAVFTYKTTVFKRYVGDSTLWEGLANRASRPVRGIACKTQEFHLEEQCSLFVRCGQT